MLAQHTPALSRSKLSAPRLAGAFLVALSLLFAHGCAAPYRATIADGGAWIASRPPLVVHAVENPTQHPAGRRADAVFHAEIVRQLEAAGWRVIDASERGAEPGALHVHPAVVIRRAKILDRVSTWDGTSQSDRSGIGAPDGFFERPYFTHGSRGAISLAVVVADEHGTKLYDHRYGIETIESDDDPDDDVWFTMPDRNERAVAGVLAELLEH